jgi:hypothetical protein
MGGNLYIAQHPQQAARRAAQPQPQPYGFVPNRVRWGSVPQGSQRVGASGVVTNRARWGIGPTFGAAVGGAPNATPRAAAPAPGAGQPAGDPNAFVPDAEYIARQSQASFDRAQQREQLEGAQQNDDADTAEAVRRLLERREPQRQAASESANRAGLLFSGQLTRTLDQQEADLARSRADAEDAAQRRRNARIAARNALDQGASVETAALIAEAVDRQVARDTTAANDNTLVGPDDPQPSAAAPTVRAGSPATSRRRAARPAAGGTSSGFGAPRGWGSAAPQATRGGLPRVTGRDAAMGGNEYIRQHPRQSRRRARGRS